MKEKISLSNLYNFISTGFGVGLAPFMPGTFGAAVMLIPIYFSVGLDAPLLFLITMLLICVGLITTAQTILKLSDKDHPAIVIDEMAGFYIVVFSLDGGLYELLLAFVIFRALDIIKPWPISYVEKKYVGALGVMADDVLAGVITAIALLLIKFSNLL
jgi:phosphatidylglycerophosphatase A